MAAGDVLLDADGNVILDDAGNVMLSDGAGDDCCCGPPVACCNGFEHRWTKMYVTFTDVAVCIGTCLGAVQPSGVASSVNVTGPPTLSGSFECDYVSTGSPLTTCFYMYAADGPWSLDFYLSGTGNHDATICDPAFFVNSWVRFQVEVRINTAPLGGGTTVAVYAYMHDTVSGFDRFLFQGSATFSDCDATVQAANNITVCNEDAFFPPQAVAINGCVAIKGGSAPTAPTC